MVLLRRYIQLTMHASQIINAIVCAHGLWKSIMTGVPVSVWNLPCWSPSALIGVCGTVTAAALLWKHAISGKHRFLYALHRFVPLVPLILQAFLVPSAPRVWQPAFAVKTSMVSMQYGAMHAAKTMLRDCLFCKLNSQGYVCIQVLLSLSTTTPLLKL